jgi:hypothetical protein
MSGEAHPLLEFVQCRRFSSHQQGDAGGNALISTTTTSAAATSPPNGLPNVEARPSGTPGQQQQQQPDAEEENHRMDGPMNDEWEQKKMNGIPAT